jgi:hypothetical protein
MARSGVKITGKGLAGVSTNLRLLSTVELLVGFPADTTERSAEDGGDEGITNAYLAYMHDNGAPEINVPARPFMDPAIKSVESKVADGFKAIGKQVLDGGGAGAVERGYHNVGLTCQLAIQNTINSNIGPPLSPRTLAARRRRGHEGTKTLVETAAMRNAASYAIRKRKKRSM